MRWQGRRRSSNVEDRRGTSIKRGGGIGIILLALVAMYFGVDPKLVMDVGSQLGVGGRQGGTSRLPAFGSRAAKGRQWWKPYWQIRKTCGTSVFSDGGARLAGNLNLVMFSGAVQSGCGMAQAAMGPFYCPADQKVYIDLTFYDEMKSKFGAPGDFAQAYVIAHEVGHHVQHLLGLDKKVGNDRHGAESGAVRLELQADCFAGLWANHTEKHKQFLETGDVEEALNAASAIGDDAMQRRSSGMVKPDSFTHGSSKQRVRWFNRGLQQGKLSACDTFSARSL